MQSVVIARCMVVAGLLCGNAGWGESVSAQEVDRQIQELRHQNQQLQQQLQKQQSVIDELAQKVTDLQKSSGERNSAAAGTEAAAPKDNLLNQAWPLKSLLLSAEGGFVFFNQGREGRFPNSEFRVDEAKIFLDGKLYEYIYFFSELNLMTREQPDENFSLGEIYVDFEELSRLWNQGSWLNLRAGRMYIPFGEEYLHRYAIDNPLISHSLSDLWGVDEGVELYGSAGRFSYAVAVQNGGKSLLRDYDADKSVAGRLGYSPSKWLHLSASAMRTGNLNTSGDKLSELWFGNGFFRALGPTDRATKFWADLAEGDIEVKLGKTRLRTAGGYVYFDDNDPLANHRRDIFYYYVEGVQQITQPWYAAVRLSQVFAKNGWPLAGNGDFSDYFFDKLTQQLTRISLGTGYYLTKNVLLKAEYTYDRGTVLGHGSRSHENLFALELAFKL